MVGHGTRPRRTVRTGAAGTARPVAGRRSDRDRPPPARGPAAQAPGRQRPRPARGLSRQRSRGRRRSPDRARRRLVAGQLSPGRGADPRNSRRSAARLLPAAAQAGSRSLCGLSARLWPDMGVRRPYRQPFRRRCAAPLSDRLSDGPAPDDRRAVGRGHHPAHRAGREPAPPDRPDGHGPTGPQPRGSVGRPHPGPGRGASRPAVRRDRDPDARTVRRTACRTAAVAGPQRDARRGLVVGPVGGTGGLCRQRGAPCAGTAWRIERDAAQRHHRLSRPVRHRLEHAVRGCQPGRGASAPPSRPCPDGFRQPQPLPQRGRGTVARQRPTRDAAGRHGGDAGGRQPARHPGRRPRLAPDRRGPPVAGTRGGLSPAAPAVAAQAGHLCGPAGLSGADRGGHGGADRAGRMADRGGLALAGRDGDAAGRAGHRAGRSDGRPVGGGGTAAGAGPARGCPARDAHACRRAGDHDRRLRPAAPVRQP